MMSGCMKLLQFILFMLLALSVGGCGGYPQNSNYPEKSSEVKMAYKACDIKNIDVNNYFVQGNNVQHYDTMPENVVVIGENETETLLALGVEAKVNIVAFAQNNRTYAMREENARKFAKLEKRPSFFVNMEYLTRLHPDLIVAQQCIFTKARLRNTRYWHDRGIHTYLPLNSNTPSKHVYRETVDNEMEFIRGVGQIFGVEENAEQIIADTYDAIEKVQEETRDREHPKVLIIEFLGALISYDSTKLAGDMVSRIGGVVPETRPVISVEHIIRQDPDILFVVSHTDYDDITGITENPALQKLKCVKNKRVYSIPLRFTYATEVRTADGIRYMAKCMYPDLYH